MILRFLFDLRSCDFVIAAVIENSSGLSVLVVVEDSPRTPHRPL